MKRFVFAAAAAAVVFSIPVLTSYAGAMSNEALHSIFQRSLDDPAGYEQDLTRESTPNGQCFNVSEAGSVERMINSALWESSKHDQVLASYVRDLDRDYSAPDFCKIS